MDANRKCVSIQKSILCSQRLNRPRVPRTSGRGSAAEILSKTVLCVISVWYTFVYIKMCIKICIKIVIHSPAALFDALQWHCDSIHSWRMPLAPFSRPLFKTHLDTFWHTGYTWNSNKTQNDSKSGDHNVAKVIAKWLLRSPGSSADFQDQQ